jgi:hypothetical protein
MEKGFVPEIWQRISFVEFESRLKKCLEEPNVGESHKKSLVEIVSDSATILDLCGKIL